TRRLGGVGIAIFILTVAGCRGAGSKVASAPEPALSGALGSNGAVAEAPPARTITYVDRHPILSKPREYWDNAGDNKIVKAGAATLIAVPSGSYNEMKQSV